MVVGVLTRMASVSCGWVLWLWRERVVAMGAHAAIELESALGRRAGERLRKSLKVTEASREELAARVQVAHRHCSRAGGV